MKYLKYFEYFENDIYNIKELTLQKLLEIKYWELTNNNGVVQWKIEQINNNSISIIINPIDNELYSNIEKHIFNPEAISMALNNLDNSDTSFRTLTEEEIKNFEFLLSLNKFNL